MEKIRGFLRRKIEDEGGQSAVARKVGISQSAINKIIHQGSQTAELATLTKIAKAYNLDITTFITEPSSTHISPEATARTKSEQQLLSMFRQLDEHRQSRIIETLEDMTLAFRESHGRDNAETSLKESNSKQRSNG